MERYGKRVWEEERGREEERGEGEGEGRKESVWLLSFPSDYSNSLTVATKLAKEQIEGEREEREKKWREGVSKRRVSEWLWEGEGDLLLG